MASRLRIIGIVVLILGLFLGVLLNIAWVTFPPFGGKTSQVLTPELINSGADRNINVGTVPSHPFFVNIKATFLLSADNAYGCNVELVYYTPEQGEVGIPGTQTTYDESSGTDGYKQYSISVMINPGAASGGFDIRLRVDNYGSSPITIANRQLNIVLGLFGILVPLVFAVTGLIMTAVSFIRKGEPGVKKKRVAPSTGWEPTLQWGGGTGTATKGEKKKPRMAISTQKGKAGQKRKVVKKVVPKGGAQVSCKFCGKQVPGNAFFCPHCYGKLR
ncbi:MAG: hypothetical protein ACXAB2_08730 [Candidatus Hodarchaeales archaeon]